MELKENQVKAKFDTLFCKEEEVTISSGFYKGTRVRIKDVIKKEEEYIYITNTLKKHVNGGYKEGEKLLCPESILKKNSKFKIPFVN